MVQAPPAKSQAIDALTGNLRHQRQPDAGLHDGPDRMDPREVLDIDRRQCCARKSTTWSWK